MTCPDESMLLLCAEKIDTSCRSHLDACGTCRETVTELERTIADVRAAAGPLPERVTAGPRRLFFAAAAVILIVTGFGLYRLSAGTRPKDPTPPVRPAVPAPAPQAADEGDEMVRKALAWLSRNQKPDGSFGNIGVTALALQAFFGAGHGENSAEYSRAVRSAIAFLLACQKEKGQFVPTEIKILYDNALAGWAMIEAVDGKRSEDPRVRQAAQKSVDYLVSAQNPGKGWRYSPKCGDNDTSVTFWAASALTAARRAGFKVPDAALDGAKAWIREVTDPATMAVGYNARGTGKVYVPGMNDAYQNHQTLSAAAMAFRLLAGDERDASMVAAVGFLATDPPSAETVEQQDYYYWHLGTLALFLGEGVESPLWKDWYARLLTALKSGRQEDGSWTPNDRWGKDQAAGPVYATAINALTLETTRRFRK